MGRGELTHSLPFVSPCRLTAPVYLAFPKCSVLFSGSNPFDMPNPTRIWSGRRDYELTRSLPFISPCRLATPVYLAFPKCSVLFSGSNPFKRYQIQLGFGAGEGIRTLDINLGKVALYQLSYARIAMRFPTL